MNVQYASETNSLGVWLLLPPTVYPNVHGAPWLKQSAHFSAPTVGWWLPRRPEGLVADKGVDRQAPGACRVSQA